VAVVETLQRDTHNTSRWRYRAQGLLEEPGLQGLPAAWGLRRSGSHRQSPELPLPFLLLSPAGTLHRESESLPRTAFRSWDNGHRDSFSIFRKHAVFTGGGCLGSARWVGAVATDGERSRYGSREGCGGALGVATGRGFPDLALTLSESLESFTCMTN